MMLRGWRTLKCVLGMHGPNFEGCGPLNGSRSNYNMGPGHRKCTFCRSEWIAHETNESRKRVTMVWKRIK